MSNEKPIGEALFGVAVCGTCGEAKLIGEDCRTCRVIKAKVDLNIELVNRINELEKLLKEACMVLDTVTKNIRYYNHKLGIDQIDFLNLEEIKKIMES